MGMSIEKAMNELKAQTRYYKDFWGADASDYVVVALNTAISTMCKYQKIVEIVSLNDEEFKQCGLKELKEILEVIADGNVD